MRTLQNIYAVIAIVLFAISNDVMAQSHNVYWENGKNVSFNNLTGSIISTSADFKWGSSGSHSKNFLDVSDNGDMDFTVHDDFEGYVGWIESYGGPDELPQFGFMFNDGVVSIIAEGMFYSENGNFNMEGSFTGFNLIRDRGQVRLLIDGMMVYESERPFDVKYYTYVSLKNNEKAISHISDIHVTYGYENELASFIPTKFSGPGTLAALSLSTNSPNYLVTTWNGEFLMSEDEFQENKANRIQTFQEHDQEELADLISEESYEDYLNSKTNSISTVNPYQVFRVYDVGTMKYEEYSYGIGADLQYVLPNGISVNGGDMSKTNGSTWSNSTLEIDNGISEAKLIDPTVKMETSVIIKEYNSEFHFGLREGGKSPSQGSSISLVDYGLYCDGSTLFQVNNGEIGEPLTNVSKGDDLVLKISEGTIDIFVSGLNMGRITPAIKPYNLDFSIKDGLISLPKVINILHWPTVTYADQDGACGMNNHVFGVVPKIDIGPKGGLSGFNYIWRNEDNITVETSPTLNATEDGLYFLNINAGLHSYYYLVPVGYNFDWAAKQNTTILSGSNALGTIIPNPASNTISGSAESINKKVSNSIAKSDWVSFDIDYSINNLTDPMGGSMTPLNYLFLRMTNSPGGMSWGTVNEPTLYMSSWKGVYYLKIWMPNNSVSVSNIPLNSGDKVLFRAKQTSSGIGTYYLYVNGFQVASIPNQPISYVPGYYWEALLGRSSSLFTGTAITQSTAWYNVFGSAPCADLVYTKLDREVDANYYWAQVNRVGFQYQVQYNDENNLEDRNLKYRVVDEFGVERMSSENASDPEVEKVYGDNRFSLPVGNLNTGFYTLEVQSEKQEKLVLRFRVD